LITNLLAIETATETCSVALVQNGEVLANISYFQGRQHSKLLIPIIKQLVENQNISLQSLSAIAISSGPGSYTGLRIGVSAAKGLCFGLNLPLIAVSTLDSLAFSVTPIALKMNALICPMIDARRMEVYTALYNNNLEIIQSIQAQILTQEYYTNLLETNKIVFVGDGTLKLIPLLQTHPNAIFLTDTICEAKYTALLGYQYYIKNQFADIQIFEPMYLKDFATTTPKQKL